MGRSGQTPRKSAICTSGAMARSFMPTVSIAGFALRLLSRGNPFPDIGQEAPQKHLQGKLDGPDTVVPGGKWCTVSGDPVGIDGARILEADDFHDAEHIDVEVTQHLVQRPGLVMLLDELKPRRELAKLRMAISAERVKQK